MNKKEIIKEFEEKYQGRTIDMLEDKQINFQSLINFKINETLFSNIQEIIIKKDNSVLIMEYSEGESFITETYDLKEIKKII